MPQGSSRVNHPLLTPRRAGRIWKGALPRRTAMGIFDRFRGAGLQRPSAPEPASDDDQAIARYRYMLRTAPPETIEQAHAEAFAQLSLSQRRRVLDELSRDIPPAER